MMLIVFRSRLTAAAGSDYSAISPGDQGARRAVSRLRDIKSFTADAGERLTMVHWR